MLFSPTVSKPVPRQIGSLAPHPEPHRPEIASRKQSSNGVISYEEDVRRLFQECNIGKGNAQLLSEALAFAAPEDLKEKEIIKVPLVYFSFDVFSALTPLSVNLRRNSTPNLAHRKSLYMHKFHGLLQVLNDPELSKNNSGRNITAPVRRRSQRKKSFWLNC